MAKYSELVEEMEDRDFVVDLITLGYDGFCQLRDSVGASQKELNDLLLAVSLAAIKGSFQIWTCRNHIMHLSMYCPRYHPTGKGGGFDLCEINCLSPGANARIKCPP